MSPPDRVASLLLLVSPLVAGWLWLRAAPYGRHAAPGWGPLLDARLAWVLMEGPALGVFAAVFLQGERGPTAWVCAGAWLVHYTHRTVIFPFRTRTPRPMPALIAATGALFNTLNAWGNATALGTAPRADLWLVFGLGVFVAGMGLNLWSDEVLLRLRDRGPGYHLPGRGAFRLVSSPNYLGELVEWAGWAIACRNLPALAFFVFSCANLVPRARAHHRWYRTRFPDLPPERRALIPWVW